MYVPFFPPIVYCFFHSRAKKMNRSSMHVGGRTTLDPYTQGRRLSMHLLPRCVKKSFSKKRKPGLDVGVNARWGRSCRQTEIKYERKQGERKKIKHKVR